MIVFIGIAIFALIACILETQFARMRKYFINNKGE